MRFLGKLINKSFDKNISATGLGVFRIAYCVVLLMEIKFLITYSSLVFDPIPGIRPFEARLDIVMVVWMMVVGFVLIGYYTRVAAIVNYAFSLVFFATLQAFEYHMHYAYMGLNFLMMIIPMGRALSIDNLRVKLKYSNSRFYFKPTIQVSQLAYYTIILVGVAFVYWGSIFYKFSSDLWMAGNGMWLPASLPQITILNDQLLLDQKWLLKFLGYLIVIFEFCLIFIFWVKRLRWLFVLIGVGLHIGIFLEFPIPLFALGVTTLYLLFVPVGFWKWLGKKMVLSKAKLTLYYDEECPLCARTRIVIEHFDVFGAIAFKGVQTFGFSEPKLSAVSKDELLDNVYSIDAKGKVRSGFSTYLKALCYLPLFFPLAILLRLPGIRQIGGMVYTLVAQNREVERCTDDNCGYEVPPPPTDMAKKKLLRNFTSRDLQLVGVKFGLGFLVIMQLNLDINSPIFTKRTYQIAAGTAKTNWIFSISDKLHSVSKIFFGITGHGVFMDWHFDGYDKILAVTWMKENGEEIWLPIINEKGNPGPYLKGSNWVNWTFRVNSPNFKLDALQSGLQRYTAYYAEQEGVDLNSANFVVKVKEIRLPKNMDWEPNYLTEQEQKPWVDYAVVHWKDEKFSFELLQDQE